MWKCGKRARSSVPFEPCATLPQIELHTLATVTWTAVESEPRALHKSNYHAHYPVGSRLWSPGHSQDGSRHPFLMDRSYLFVLDMAGSSFGRRPSSLDDGNSKFNQYSLADQVWMLTDIFVGQFVSQSNPLGLMLHRSPVDNRLAELLDDGLVDSVTLHAC